MKLFLLSACLAAPLALLGAADAAPTQFQLVFEGHHVVAGFPTPTGLAHEGPFTTSSPLCPSGYGRDTAQTDTVATRLFDCGPGGATFTALVNTHLAEHGGTGVWQIISGTGALADLRGKGTFNSVRVSGTDDDFMSITFRSTWAGVVDLDASPPNIAVMRASAKRLARPRGTYLLHVALSLSDGGGGPVTYRLTLFDPVRGSLAHRSGTTTGPLSVAFKVRPKAKTRALRLEVDAVDGVGNESGLKRAIRIR